MRFLSKYGRLIVQCRQMQATAYANGVVQVSQEPIYAVFEPHGVLPDERALALATFTFQGQYQEMDEATPYPPDYRISVYDTKRAQDDSGWADETRFEVEAVLRSRAKIGEDILEVPATFFDPPWPKYDEYKGSPAQLVRKLVDEGHDLGAVLEYEQANLNRQPVIEALDAALISTPLEEEVVG